MNAPTCPICGAPARVERREFVFHVARWADGLPHTGQRLRCTSEPPHAWEVEWRLDEPRS